MKFWNKWVRALEPYTPGEQINDPDVTKLNTNENAFPVPESILLEIRKFVSGNLRLYPQPVHDDLRKAVSKAMGIGMENIFAGNGSDEVLSLIYRSFLERSDEILIPDPTYSLYPVLAQMVGVRIKEIPTSDDFIININKFFGSQKLTIIANPNAPTGIELPHQKIKKLAGELKGLLVIDEAYIDFGAESALGLVEKFDNIIIVQTLSKGYSLAGIRLGFAFANKNLVEALYRMKDSYNISALTQAAGIAVYNNLDDYKTNRQMAVWNRDFLAEELTKRGFKLTNSKANFVFASHQAVEASLLTKTLKESNILVRYFAQESTRDWIRITVGTMQQIKSFLKILDKIL